MSRAGPAATPSIAHDGFMPALANPAMAAVRADIPRFTDLKPTVMLGKTLQG